MLTILSAAWNKTNSSTPIFNFLGNFLGVVGVIKSDRLDFEWLWNVGTGCNCHITVVDILYHVL